MLPKVIFVGQSGNKKRFTRFRTLYTSKAEAEKKAKEFKKGNYTRIIKLYTDDRQKVYGIFYRIKE